MKIRASKKDLTITSQCEFETKNVALKDTKAWKEIQNPYWGSHMRRSIVQIFNDVGKLYMLSYENIGCMRSIHYNNGLGVGRPPWLHVMYSLFALSEGLYTHSNSSTKQPQ